MKARGLWMIVGGIAALLMGAGIAGAAPLRRPASPVAVAATVASGISYQGRLTDTGGRALNGTYTMRFVVYDDAVAGSSLWDSGDTAVVVEDGLFDTVLGVDQEVFDGQALWLSIHVNGETLSPRQEILPAPYALSMRPGADIVGDAIGAADAVLAGYAPATGTALYADANGGVGLFGDSENSYGVWGSSNDSWGGYFTSAEGYGIRVKTDGLDHFDHGAYVTANGGYGVYAQSAENQAVRGEAGDVTGFLQPLGAVGIVGIGANRGAFGSSGFGTGLYGASNSNYGLWGQSTNYRGATGRTSRSDNNYGLYTPDNLYSLNVNLAGAVMQVMQNGGAEPLSPGDVVVFNGINRSVAAIDGPIVQVTRAEAANSTGVAGVVFSRFNIDAVDPDRESPDGLAQGKPAAMEVTPAGRALSGDYVLVVVLGPAQVKSSALAGESIQPGDLLSTGGTPGAARKARTVSIDGVATTIPGTVFAKALESPSEKRDLFYVYVTLQ